MYNVEVECSQWNFSIESQLHALITVPPHPIGQYLVIKHVDYQGYAEELWNNFGLGLGGSINTGVLSPHTSHSVTAARLLHNGHMLTLSYLVSLCNCAVFTLVVSVDCLWTLCNTCNVLVGLYVFISKDSVIHACSS